MNRKGALWVVTRSLPVHRGGGMERVAFHTAVGLARRGWKIDLVTTRLDSDPGLPASITVHGLDAPPGRYSRAFSRRLADWAAARSTPDLILSISAGANPLVARHREIPSIFQSHGSAWSEMTAKWKNLDPRAIARLGAYLHVERRTLAMYDRIVAVGPAVVGYLRARPYRFLDGSRIVEIPNGIDTDACARTDDIDRAAVRRRLGVAPGGRLLLVACRLVRGKGVRALLEAYATMKERRKVWLAIAGARREEKSLRRLARRKRLGAVRFLGPIDHAALLEAMRASDLLVQVGTGSEGLPLVLLEALCTGSPVLVSRRYSLPPFERREAILTVEPTDRTAIAAALERGTRLGAPLREVAAAARERFSLDRMIDGYEEVIEELICEKGKGTSGAHHDRHSASTSS